MLTFPYRLLRAPGERLELVGTHRYGEQETVCTHEQAERNAYGAVRAYQRAHGAAQLIDNHQVVTGMTIPELGIKPTDFIYMTDGYAHLGEAVRAGDATWHGLEQALDKVQPPYGVLQYRDVCLLCAAQLCGKIDNVHARHILRWAQKEEEEYED